MVHDGQSKRKLGDIWTHLVLSAFTLLGPPLGMAAGVRGVFYAAQVGPLARDEANGLCSRIKSAGGKCFTQEN
jgi:hypothetical protein